MEIINIEARTFEAMMERFEVFVQELNKFCHKYSSQRLEKWLDGQEVCMVLNISKRKLQTLRENGSLAYTKVEHKFFYKPSDVEKVINAVGKGVIYG